MKSLLLIIAVHVGLSAVVPAAAVAASVKGYRVETCRACRGDGWSHWKHHIRWEEAWTCGCGGLGCSSLWLLGSEPDVYYELYIRE